METRWLPGKVLGQSVGFRGIPCPSRKSFLQRKPRDTQNRSTIRISLEEFHSWSPWSCLLPCRIELASNNLETPAGVTDFVFHLTLDRQVVSVTPCSWFLTGGKHFEGGDS